MTFVLAVYQGSTPLPETQVRGGTYLPEGAAGYAVHEAEGIEAAIALAARIPAARLGGGVEIRPAEKYW